MASDPEVIAKAHAMCREARRRNSNNWCHAICQMLHFGMAAECEDAVATYGEKARASLTAGAPDEH